MRYKNPERTGHLLIAGMALFTILMFSSARAEERNFLPLQQKTSSIASLQGKHHRQFIPLTGAGRMETARPSMPLNGGRHAQDRRWKLSELRNHQPTPKAQDVPDEVKLAMATGAYTPRAAQAQQPTADTPPQHTRETVTQEMIAAALAPVIRSARTDEDIDTDIEDAEKALAASIATLKPEPVNVTPADFVWPVAGEHYRISSGYGYRKHPVTGKRAFHAGIDIPAPSGTAVLAAAAGAVSAVGEHPRLGRYVRVDHPDGAYSLYGHLQKWIVRKGQQVGAGEVIGHVGSTGRSTGPHLDFSIRRDGAPMNPMTFLAAAQEQKKLAFNR